MGAGGSKKLVIDPYPSQGSLEGVSIAKAQGCNECRFSIPAGVSSANVKLNRPKKKDIPSNFSPDTKLLITPALSFEVQFNEASIPVKSMTLYHPCPIRVENIQYDAVLCLNDPGFPDTQSHIILIPIKAVSNPDDRANFFSRFVPYMAALKEPKPDSGGDYPEIEVPVGKDWSLTTLFPVSLTNTGTPEVDSGYYVWKAGGTYEGYKQDNPNWDWYRWRPAANNPTYIMLGSAVPISTTDLQTITSTLPSTPFRPPFPIHPVPAEFVYKPCQKAKASSPVKETFDNQCDPFSPNAKYPPSPVNVDALFGFTYTILSIVGLVLIVWVVMKLADNPFWDKVKGLGEYLGKGLAKAFKGAKRAAEEQAAATPEPEETKTSE
jgi:hypothetical protein